MEKISDELFGLICPNIHSRFPYSLLLCKSALNDKSHGACQPNSENYWENVYEMPMSSAEEKEEYLKGGPKSLRSDTFFFVAGKMVIHNIATYQVNDALFDKQK